MLQDAYERMRYQPTIPREELRLVELACMMESLPSSYFQYYYFKDEILAELQAKPTTRAQDIMAQVPDYWTHYREQAACEIPELDPQHSRGGIHELELAIDVMDAIYNDRKEVWYVNIPNNDSLADFPDDRVVETVAYVDRQGVVPLVQGHLPRPVRGGLERRSLVGARSDRNHLAVGPRGAGRIGRRRAHRRRGAGGAREVLG